MNIGESYHRSTAGQAWDAIVIGSGIGGLTTAAFLARTGQRVLVLEKHSTAGGATQTFRRAGYEWDAGLHYMGDVHRPTSGLRRIFDHISGGKLEWAPMPDVYNRVFIGDREYQYRSGVQRFKDRMKEYFPHESGAIDQYVDLVFAANRAARPYLAHRSLPHSVADTLYDDMAAPFRSYADRTVTEVLTDLTDDAELRAVLSGHYGDYSLAPGRASFGMHAMLIRHYINGASFPVGGSARLAETATDVITGAGGAVLISADVATVELDDKGAARGVVMTDGKSFRAPLVISDTGALNTLTRLLPDQTPAAARLVDSLRAVGPSQTYVMLNLGIRESGDRLDLDPANIWAHAGPDLDGDIAAFEADPEHHAMPTYFLTFPSLKDPSWESRYPARTTIDIAGLTTWSLFEPYAGSAWMRRGADYERLKDRLTEELLSQVFRFCPQLEGRIDHTELATPLSFNHFLGREKGDFMSLAHTPQRFALRDLGAHTHVPGLLLTGQDVASAGVSGAIMGGVVAASAALERDALEELATG